MLYSSLRTLPRVYSMSSHNTLHLSSLVSTWEQLLQIAAVQNRLNFSTNNEIVHRGWGIVITAVLKLLLKCVHNFDRRYVFELTEGLHSMNYFVYKCMQNTLFNICMRHHVIVVVPILYARTWLHGISL